MSSGEELNAMYSMLTNAHLQEGVCAKAGVTPGGGHMRRVWQGGRGRGRVVGASMITPTTLLQAPKPYSLSRWAVPGVIKATP